MTFVAIGALRVNLLHMYNILLLCNSKEFMLPTYFLNLNSIFETPFPLYCPKVMMYIEILRPMVDYLIK